MGKKGYIFLFPFHPVALILKNESNAAPCRQTLGYDFPDGLFAKRTVSLMRAGIKWILEDTEETFAIVAQECILLSERIGHLLHGFFLGGKHHADEHIRVAWVWVFVRHWSLLSSLVFKVQEFKVQGFRSSTLNIELGFYLRQISCQVTLHHVVLVVRRVAGGRRVP